MLRKDMTLPVPYHETLDIHDASKINQFLDCPRQYFYRYVLGWTLSGSNLHLVFGQAWHNAMEHLLLHGYGDESVVNAYKAFMSHWEMFPNMEDHKSKNPTNALLALTQYVVTYAKDNFKVLYTEVAGNVLISKNRQLHFRLDAVCEGKDGKKFILEHKTGSRLSQAWTDQWMNSFQIWLYTHALFSGYDIGEVYGVRVNGAIFKTKTVDLLRVPIRKSWDVMSEGVWAANHYMDMIDWNFNSLSKCSPDDKYMGAFPKNPQSCTKYFGCPYFDMCTLWANPLTHIAKVPIGYELQRWNPSDNDSTAKAILDDGKVIPNE